MTITTSSSPYYDDFDPTKKYSQVLAVPGNVAQARDITQSQTILLHMLKKLSSSMFNEGSILSGMSFSISGTTLTVESGKVYLDGIVHEFDQQDIEISGVGDENIGVTLEKSIVTEVEDASLLDPVLESESYHQPGSHRIKVIPKLVRNDPTSPTIYTLRDGALTISRERPQFDIVLDLLAKRTFEESGNYRIEGLGLSTRDYNSSQVSLIVDPGKAYVYGYQVHKPSSHILQVSKAQNFRSVIGELKTYTSGTDLYKLNNTYTKHITQVIGTVEVSQTLTKGTTNEIVTLGNTPVVSIQSVVQGGTTYASGTDYKLTGDALDWSLGGAEPTTGTTYAVTYRYSKVMSPTTDYKLTMTNDDGYLDFSPTGDNPVSSSTVIVSYDYYLSRKDRVYMDQNGDITIIQGQSDVPSLCIAPYDTDSTKLSLGTLHFMPNSDTVYVYSESVSRVTMGDISSILDRLDNLEYNVALNDLDNEAMQGESPTDLKGIFTDGFLGFGKCDLAHPSFSASIDIGNQELVLPVDTEVHSLSMDTVTSTNVTKHATGMITLGYTDQLVVSQSLATDATNVNPYSVFPPLSKIDIEPKADNWIDESTVQINEALSAVKRMSNWWNWKRDTVISKSVSKSTVDTFIDYARRIEIVVTAREFPPNLNSLAASIDGSKVNLTPVGTTVAGTETGTIRTNSIGFAQGKFTIPEKTRTGTRTIMLGNGVASAEATFWSQGIQRVNTIKEVTTITQRIGTAVNRDPVAQSFELPVDRFVTKVRLYFGNKSTTMPVSVTLRSMVNGFPGTDVLAEKTLYPNSVNVSSDATVATEVVFDNPVFCQGNTQYCIVVVTESSEYTLHIATLGLKTYTGQTLLTQPYNQGVMFKSSNNLTWTPQQESDLKFEIYGAVFSTSGTINFDNVVTDTDLLVLCADNSLLNGTSCHWEYRIGLDGTWLPIETYSTRDLSTVASSVYIRAKYSGTAYISPIIYHPTVKLIAGVTQSQSTYISKSISTSQVYTDVKQVIEVILPPGSSANAQLCTDGSTWVSGTLSSTEPLSDGFTRLTYSYTLPSGSSSTFRSRVNLSGSRTSKPKARKLLNILK